MTNTIPSVPRELLAELQEHIDCHRDAVLWGKVCDLLSATSPTDHVEDVRVMVKAQCVVMPERKTKADYGVYIDEFADEAAAIYNAALDEVARLTAATAAPAADAGIVDMYRHLQKVTPYRFKKIQDASITDGGDVMYFHKDRFDAALIADMAANCAAKVVV